MNGSFRTTLLGDEQKINRSHFQYEWLLNGAPLMKSHRYALSYDFGYVALNILYCFPEDRYYMR